VLKWVFAVIDDTTLSLHRQLITLSIACVVCQSRLVAMLTINQSSCRMNSKGPFTLDMMHCVAEVQCSASSVNEP